MHAKIDGLFARKTAAVLTPIYFKLRN